MSSPRRRGSRVKSYVRYKTLKRILYSHLLILDPGSWPGMTKYNIMDNFQKTVNLKDKADRERQRLLYGEPEKTPARHALQGEAGGEKKVKSKAEDIDEVYERKGSANSEDNLRKINRPIIKNVNEKLIKYAVMVLAVVLVIATVYFLFFRNSGDKQKADNNLNANWYAIKLNNNEMYYGQIEDTSADPVIIKNVYYDYDMLNKTEKEAGAAASLRLVKKGKETYGPSGVMEVVRSNVAYMDVLKSDSKVLKAILDYENKDK